MELIDVVMKLVGPVDPVGETHTDDKRLDNLIVLRDLTRELLDRIESVAEASDGHMASVKVAKDCAASFLADVRGVQASQRAQPHDGCLCVECEAIRKARNAGVGIPQPGQENNDA